MSARKQNGQQKNALKKNGDRVMNVWIARDIDGRLFMYFVEPVFSGTYWKADKYSSMVDISNTELDETYKSLSCKDGPLKLKLRK